MLLMMDVSRACCCSASMRELQSRRRLRSVVRCRITCILTLSYWSVSTLCLPCSLRFLTWLVSSINYGCTEYSISPNSRPSGALSTNSTTKITLNTNNFFLTGQTVYTLLCRCQKLHHIFTNHSYKYLILTTVY